MAASTSKVYIDKAKERAVFVYERNCMDGFKCGEGNLVILENGKDGVASFKTV
ncbi:hypothetical protein [Pontibacter korlensis]|uniref:hypothetical protein n=1 Tax=Pontibacter korlensis TaxID=400092 RepID=UPI00130E01DA|nr:hypothetical protein [Pontibacter korlensis]